MIRTLTFALRRDPDTSRHIGYYATQQNLAYNHAVDVLNREPNLPKRSGQNHPDALNKRITVWRQANRQKADAPYYIHQEGGEQAWELALGQSAITGSSYGTTRTHRQSRGPWRSTQAPRHPPTSPHPGSSQPQTTPPQPHHHRPAALPSQQRRKDPRQPTVRFLRHASNPPEPQIPGHPLHTTRPREELQCPNTACPQALLPTRPSRSARARTHRAHQHRKPRRHPWSRPRHQEPPCRQLGAPRPQPTVSKTAYPPAQAPARHRRQAPRQQAPATRSRQSARTIPSLHPATQPRPPPANPRHPAGSKAQDGRRREPALHQHDGFRPWHQRSTGPQRCRQTQTQRKPRRVSHRLRGKTPTRRSRQTRHPHHLRPTARHVTDLPALRRPAPRQPREPSGFPMPEL